MRGRRGSPWCCYLLPAAPGCDMGRGAGSLRGARTTRWSCRPGTCARRGAKRPSMRASVRRDRPRTAARPRGSSRRRARRRKAARTRRAAWRAPAACARRTSTRRPCRSRWRSAKPVPAAPCASRRRWLPRVPPNRTRCCAGCGWGRPPSRPTACRCRRGPGFRRRARRPGSGDGKKACAWLQRASDGLAHWKTARGRPARAFRGAVDGANAMPGAMPDQQPGFAACRRRSAAAPRRGPCGEPAGTRANRAQGTPIRNM
jgi:hypothetical protein